MPITAVAISDKELKEIRSAFNKMLRPLKQKLKGNDLELLNKAYDMAVDGHKFQRRKSGEPYIFHPIEVARICHEEIGLGPTAVICAILHDVVEDTDYTQKDIADNFNEKISLIVDGLTKLDGLYNDSDSPQAENLKKVLSTLVYDVRVVLIKMADRLHNMRTIGPMPIHKQLKIAAETKYIYSPLAHRLGLYQIRTEYEDICMKITNREHYADIAKKITDTQSERDVYIKEFIKPIKKQLKKEGTKFKVAGRPKSISSIWNKIKNKNVSFEEIYDLFAVRIIIDVPPEEEKQACWKVYSLITDVYSPIPERLKDWVTTPKSNGYESLHTTVVGPDGKFVEVQIRTERMNEIAEKGFAAHWKYKNVKNVKDVYANWLDNVRDILEAPHDNAIEFIDDFKSNLFKEEVYVFTPAGDMKILPKGASALDFAFHIHTDIGYKATAIKVNNKLVPMGHVLENGDQVSVKTHKNQKPKENWLNLVTTGKAKNKIRSSMKEERRKIGELGKEDLQRKLKNMKADFEENIEMLVNHFGFTNRPDLYYAIAEEQLKLSELKKFDVIAKKLVKKEIEADVEKAVQDDAPKTRPGRFSKNDHKDMIYVNGEPASMYSFSLAQCCTPVQGDNIFGFLTLNTGLKIHRTDCPNATNMIANYGYRTLKAEWGGKGSSDFMIRLSIEGVDSGVGVISAISDVISSKMGLNMRAFNIEGEEGVFKAIVKVAVKNKDQMKLLIKSLKTIDGISTVDRIDD
jgi:GTP pyrophosphokinase